MFTLYQSNNLDILKRNILSIIKKENNINNIFLSKIFILISNKNISLNLKIFLAEKLGICANFNFLLVGDFIWKFCKNIIPDISKKYYFNKYNLVWVIFNILPKVIDLKEFLFIKNYLKDDYNYEKLFNLSFKISNIYDEYLMYRIDWLYEWKNYRYIKNINNFIHQKWQSILWRKIVKYFINNFSYKWNKSDIYIKILKILKNKNFIFPKNIINYICLFNISFIPPIHLDILYSISKYRNVYYFLFNPSYKFWYEKFYFDNKKNIFLKRKKKYSFIYKFYNIKNNYNSLLLNYGKSFSETLLLLLKLNIKEVSYFLNINNNNKLNIIKYNILNFKDIVFNKKYSYKNKDNSIVISRSCGYLEEVKKLKNFLLDLIINKNYNINDIIVNVTDINIYYSYINSVFSDLKYKKYLPYKILEDNNYIYENELLNIFLNLLNISNLEYNFTELLCFLKKKIIFKKFNINYEELKIIIYIIKNIGLNINLKNNMFYYKKFNYLTWINSLRRILLGFCINNEYCIWNNIIPYTFLSNNFYYNLIEKICDFIYKVLYWKDILNKKYLFNDWVFICIKFINVFFYKKYINKSIFLNKKNFINILENYNICKFNKYIDINIFKKILINFLKYKNKKKIYSIDCINFCSFIYSESLFFKITCLIGMNENIFLKNKVYCDFNLINFNPRLGDRDKIGYNKYLFLQKILFCNILYISYVNFCFIKNNFCFPSILLIFFKNYIDTFIKKIDFYKLNKKKSIYIKKKIIKEKYNLNILNYVNRNYYFNKYKGKYIINLIQLHNFWTNPIKYFLYFFNKINYFISDIYINKNEFFNLNIKRIYLIRYKIINILLKYEYNKNIFLYLQHLNFLPLSFLGNILWEKEKENIFFLVNNIKKYYFKINRININFKFNNFFIKGYIYRYDKFGLFKWLPKKLNLIDALLFWIDHLIYCYIEGNSCSYLYGYNGIWCFKPLNKNICIKYINKYVNAYLNGCNYPLLFLPKSSNIWIFSSYGFNKKKILNEYCLNKAKEKLFNTLYGNFFIKGEIDDIYISYVIKKYYNFLNIEFIISEIENWLLPVFNNLIINNRKY